MVTPRISVRKVVRAPAAHNLARQPPLPPGNRLPLKTGILKIYGMFSPATGRASTVRLRLCPGWPQTRDAGASVSSGAAVPPASIPSVPGFPSSAEEEAPDEKAPLSCAARLPATTLLILCRAKAIMPDAMRRGCPQCQPRPSKKAPPVQVRGRLRTREYGSKPAAASRRRRLASSTEAFSCIVTFSCVEETAIANPRQCPHRRGPEWP